MSVMLIYSASMGVFFIKSWQLLNSCRKDPLCDPDFSFSLFPFLAEVSFWLIVLYVPIALELKPRIIFNQRRNWWIALLVLTLAGWHIISEDFVAIVRGFIYLDVITTDIFFYTLIGIFAPWFIWLLLGRIERPRPSLPTMLIYSISVTNASTRLWIEVSACKLAMNLCEVNFSLPLFLGKIALWFVPLYTLMKLISRVEFGKNLLN